MNTTLLMSSAQYFSNQAQINPYYHQEVVDVAGAEHEHAAIRGLFTQAGITVHSVPAPTDSQDGVYAANWALVYGVKAVMARLPNARKAEEAYAAKVLAERGFEVITVPQDWRFSGQGDALRCGQLLFCGSGYRSDEAAQSFAADALGLKRIQLRAVPELDSDGKPVINAASGWPDSFYYDLDLALSIIREPSGDQAGLIAYCPEALTAESQQILRDLPIDKIIVSETEARTHFACNLVSTGETVILSGDAPNFAADLRAHGLRVVSPPHVTELVKGGGFIRCISLSLD